MLLADLGRSYPTHLLQDDVVLERLVLYFLEILGTRRHLNYLHWLAVHFLNHSVILLVMALMSAVKEVCLRGLHVIE